MKITKIFLFIALGLVLLGGAIFLIVSSANKFDFSVSNKYEKKDQIINEAVEKVQINTDIANIIIKEDSELKVEWYETERTEYEIKVEANELIVNEKTIKKFSFRWLFIKKEQMTIYLPSNVYDALVIDGETSNVDISGNITFKNVNIKVSTGDVEYKAKVENDINVKVSTGDILIKDVYANDITLESSTGSQNLENIYANNISSESSTGSNTFKNINVTNLFKVKATTGKLTLNNVNAKDIDLEGTTGKKKLTKTIATNNLKIKSSTGDIILEEVDGASINISATTGDVVGSLLSDKIFFCESDTSKPNFPKTTTGGTCEITTTTGKIEITIAK